MKQLKVEMGDSMEMGTIHAGDYLVSESKCCGLQLFVSAFSTI